MKNEIELPENWICVIKTSHGEIFEKKDGSVIITGTWNGEGVVYTVRYANKIK